MDDGEEHNPLALESLDADSLRTALLNVEKAIPDLLLEIKPILAYLGASDDNEELKAASQDAVQRYLGTLNDIQYVLRYAASYLQSTRVSPSVLRPPAPEAIPRPLAATMHYTRAPGGAEAQLGLYAQRQEVAALREMLAAVKGMRAALPGEGEKKKGEGAGEGQGKGGEGKEGEGL